jgi:thiamine biosynthesis lipoprotein
MITFKRLISAAAFLTLAAIVSGCGQPEQQQIDGKTMGTYYSIKYVSSLPVSRTATIKSEIDMRLERINHQMSTYRSDSEIVLFNESRQINRPIPVSPETVLVVNEAIRIAGLTEGGLDITAGPLVNLWGFGPTQMAEIAPPSAQDIQLRLSWSGLDKLKVEPRALIKTIPQLTLDLSAIAKGYGVDVIADYLESIGIDNYLVDIGGEVRAKGKNQGGKIWRIAIEKPTSGLQQQVQRIIEVHNVSVATSGDYRNYFDANGTRYSHTIDPKTGYPIQNDIASITVIASSCMTADGLATGLGVLGADKAIDIADKLDLAVFIVNHAENGFQERYSKAFKRDYIN